MSFKKWKIWFKHLPISLKWFVVLILLRPIIDQFYFLKHISIFLSPLYVVGFLTPFLLILSFLSRGFPKKYKSFVIDFNFGLWGLLVVVNLVFLVFIKPSIGSIASVLKLITPILLFFYFRHFIKSRINLIGILQAILYSALVPALLLIYENIFNPINAEYLTESRGGGARFAGGYADVMNYAVYIAAALLIKGYFFLLKSKMKKSNLKQWCGLLSIVVICFIGLSGIKQTASWVVAVFLISLFLYFKMSSLKGLLVAVIVIPIMVVIGNITYDEKIEPLINKEIQVLEGEKEVERSFNGRMGRWIDYFDIWFEMPVVSNLIGAPTSGQRESTGMTGGIVHNEFIRILFLSGVVGLGLFLAFLFSVFLRIRYLAKAERFLVIGALGVFSLFSISTTPLFYPTLLYYFLPIVAYASLPRLILKLNAQT